MKVSGLEQDEQIFSEFLATKKDILENIFHFVRKQMRKQYWDPQHFRMNRLSFGDFAGMIERLGESYDGPVFQYVQEDVIYCILTTYMISDDEITVDTVICKLENYQEGNRVWQILDGEFGWGNGGEEDMLDLEAILRNDDEEWVEQAQLGMLDE